MARKRDTRLPTMLMVIHVVRGHRRTVNISYHENGNRHYESHYGEHQGNSYDGKKQGEWYIYDEDEESKNRKITYKNGARAKADNFPPFSTSSKQSIIQTPER